MSDDAADGHPEARTPGAGELDGGAAAIEGADPAMLIAGLDDLDASDVLAVAAELVAAPRRARGRPAGAGNRKNADMIAYLAAKGHRDPWVTLSMIQTADPVKLAEMLAKPVIVEGVPLMRDGKPMTVPADPLAVLAVQERAATTLMKYHHSQKPQQLDLPIVGDRRPVMIVGEMNVSIGQLDDEGFMTMATAMPRGEKANEINGDIVREEGAISHEKPST